MDFSNPTVLANAMIFHDTMVNLQNPINIPTTTTSYYIPPTTFPHTYSEYPSFSMNGSSASEYEFPEPIQDTINTPYTLEDGLTGEYLRIIMGMLGESVLIASVSLNNPQPTKIDTIKLFIQERISDFTSSQIKSILCVISGEFSEEFRQHFLHRCKKYEEINDKIIIMKEM